MISPANFAFFLTGLRVMFGESYGTTPIWIDKLVRTVPSSTDTEGYGWTGMLDKPRLWDGPRVVHQPAPQTYFLQNQLWELTESIDKLRLDDDKYGIYYRTIPDMGVSMKKNPDWQLRDLLENAGKQTGARQKGLDGLTHWNTAHPVDFYDASKGTYCNDFLGGVSVGGITVGGVLTPNAYATLRQEFMNRKAENGEKLGLVPTLTWGPAQLDVVAKYILQAEILGLKSAYGATDNVGSATNVLRASTDWWMNADLTSNTTWYMTDQSRGDKPFIRQQRQAVTLVQRTSPTDPVVFDTHTYLFGADERFTVGWGPAFLSARSGS